MPLLDLAVTVVVAAFAVFGFARGFVRGLLDLLLLAAALSLAIRFHRPFAGVLAEGGLERGLAPVVGFVAMFLGVMLLGGLALRAALAPARAFPWPTPLPFLNRLLGLAPGIVKGIVAAGFLLAPLSALGEEFGLTRYFANARLAPALAATASRIVDAATDGSWLPVGDGAPPFDPLPNLRDLPFGDIFPASGSVAPPQPAPAVDHPSLG
jgi:uncharacterized membrane protein required for colicin V production